MKYHLAVVEGPHDASFFGVLLRELGFDKVETVAAVDPFWGGLIPRVFPTGDRLEHVVRYPDMYTRSGADARSVAVSVAGGDSRLLSELRAALEILDVTSMSGVCIVADADDQNAPHRFAQLLAGLTALNTSHGPGGKEGGAAGVPGFPLVLPAAAGDIAAGIPKVGIYVLPDNAQPGTLDDILVACAASSLPSLCGPAKALVAAVDANGTAGDPVLKPLRKPSGPLKATAGIIGNLLHPGSATSASVERGPWLRSATGHEIGLSSLRGFLANWLA
ncbi:hypothetical protein HNO88_002589 [Novosphingobium chloroacetimidivorans]|uniref:DUF4276 family protein n=1 Tax=Novosphingobium chloroacetimidivorans TaxID=1428314 RepID=A0A7W7KAZ8_9SPHN|nr:hypothetical protein [Novosphingobium chloroacetimidivorans]